MLALLLAGGKILRPLVRKKHTMVHAPVVMSRLFLRLVLDRLSSFVCELSKALPLLES